MDEMKLQEILDDAALRLSLGRYSNADAAVHDLVAEVRRLTAALAAREGYDMDHALRDAAEQAELLQHGAERARDEARGELARLRAEHAAALATARREGAEEMRSRCAAVAEASAAHATQVVGGWPRFLVSKEIASEIAALPLDAPGGAT